MYPTFIVFASPALAVDILSIFATGSPIMDVDFDSSAHTLSHFMLATGSSGRLNGIGVFRGANDEPILRNQFGHMKIFHHDNTTTFVTLQCCDVVDAESTFGWTWN